MTYRHRCDFCSRTRCLADSFPGSAGERDWGACAECAALVRSRSLEELALLAAWALCELENLPDSSADSLTPVLADMFRPVVVGWVQ